MLHKVLAKLTGKESFALKAHSLETGRSLDETAQLFETFRRLDRRGIGYDLVAEVMDQFDKPDVPFYVLKAELLKLQ